MSRKIMAALNFEEHIEVAASGKYLNINDLSNLFTTA